MSAQQGHGQGHEPAIGIGGPTSGEAGSTLTHETMAETGGSGVNEQAEDKKQRSTSPAPAADSGNRQGPAPEGADTAATAVGRGYQDTRSSQAGKLPTGLGAPETGGNQDERDLAPPRKE
jgi:hypothetical protein